jgi:hypothetical protein
MRKERQDRTPNEVGLLWCPKCSSWLPAEEFISRQSKRAGYTDYCDGCRDIARESMRLYHARRKQGVAVSRGRPSLDGVLYPVKVHFTMPRELLPEIEAAVRAEISKFLEANKGHPDVELARKEYGVTSTALEPQGSNRQRAPRPGTQANTPRPYNDDQQLFFDTCCPSTRKRLEDIIKAQSKNKWNWWDSLYLGWVKAGKPVNYNHKTQSSEPAQPGEDHIASGQ